jgi:hypothetical protein
MHICEIVQNVYAYISTILKVCLVATFVVEKCVQDVQNVI